VLYDGVPAVRGLSLAVNEGKIASIIGANGAGKSSVLRAISGVKKVSSGEIWYCGERIDSLQAHSYCSSRNYPGFGKAEEFFLCSA